MSFSSAVKNQLCRLENEENCCILAEIAAVTGISGIYKTEGDTVFKVRVISENAAFARRLYSNIKRLFDSYPEVIIRKNRKLKKHTTFIIAFRLPADRENILSNMILLLDSKELISFMTGITGNECCKRAYLRGAFLAGGSISDPEKTYHLEVTNHHRYTAYHIVRLMRGYGLNPKVINRKGCYVVYLKEGENIVDFLNIIGAHSALLEIENIRILKQMRNNVNRVVNCETANLEKTVNASVTHLENIKYIARSIGMENIPESLRIIADLRLKFPDASLKELGQMLKPPLGKSGVNHRLRRLGEIAQGHKDIHASQQNNYSDK